MNVDPTPLEIAEKQAALDASIMESLKARLATTRLEQVTPNRAQRRQRAATPKAMSSTVARARRKIRKRQENASRARNRA